MFWERSSQSIRRLLLSGVSLFLTAISVPAQPTTLTNAWELQIRAAGDSSPAIAADGTIYFGTFAGELWAVNPNGTKKWTFTTGHGGVLGIEIKSSPAVGADGTVYFGCRDRKFYALSAEGKKKWVFETGGWVDSSPAIAADGTLYFGSWDKRFYALRPNGLKKWEFVTGGEVVSSPAVATNGTVYFGSHDGKLYALSSSGVKTWEFASGGAIISSPAIDAAGLIYFSSVDGHIYAVNPNGALHWKLRTGGITESSPIIGEDGTIYIGVNEKLFGISKEGQKVWERVAVNGSVETVEASLFALEGGYTGFVSRYGMVTILDTEKTPRWTSYLYGHGHSSPAIGKDGTIYTFAHVLNKGYFFRALQSSLPLARSPWPKFRGNLQNTGRPLQAE